jgi:hypothetical protein
VEVMMTLQRSSSQNSQISFAIEKRLQRRPLLFSFQGHSADCLSLSATKRSDSRCCDSVQMVEKVV